MKIRTAFGSMSLLVACFGSPLLAQPQPAPLSIEQAEEDLAFARGVDAYIWAYPLAITAATAETRDQHRQAAARTATRRSTASAMSAS